ncbi:hypothetical protein PR202_ga16396 [Eleusine coracana subsp. coracana]|uniref:Uncharacterized protein n=1 Tax=Eleusine coracana subsp. coracana TaxID=191504 RepID=A0AAV5CN25_ELECO|nr:hypothetical protein PR202_ga16396 [Eleusine coracana subsp. coracana]
MATPITYSVRVSSETHKIETWLASDEALARQLQEEENSHVAATTREFAGTAHSQNLSLRLREDNVDPDNMSYEQLQALGDAVGNESRGLSDDLISYLVPFKHKCNLFSRKKNTEELHNPLAQDQQAPQWRKKLRTAVCYRPATSPDDPASAIPRTCTGVRYALYARRPRAPLPTTGLSRARKKREGGEQAWFDQRAGLSRVVWPESRRGMPVAEGYDESGESAATSCCSRTGGGGGKRPGGGCVDGNKLLLPHQRSARTGCDKRGREGDRGEGTQLVGGGCLRGENKDDDNEESPLHRRHGHRGGGVAMVALALRRNPPPPLSKSPGSLLLHSKSLTLFH